MALKSGKLRTELDYLSTIFLADSYHSCFHHVTAISMVRPKSVSKAKDRLMEQVG
jgi:hypothetical protein